MNMVLPPKTSWENLGGAERRGETPAHSLSCKTNPEEFRRGQKEEGGDDMSSQPPRSPHVGNHRLRDAHTRVSTRKHPESDQIWAEQDDWPETTQKLTPLA